MYFLGIKLPHWYGFLGLGLIVSSFISWYLPFTNINLIIFNMFFMVGNILFFDFLSYEMSGFSLLHATRGKHISHFFLLGFIAGFILELYIHWFGKFWYYPYWNTYQYLLYFIPGFGVYVFYLTETYLGTKAVLEHFFKKRHSLKENFVGFKRLFLVLGLIGAFGLGLVSMFFALQAGFGKSFEDFLSVNSVPVLEKTMIVPLFFVAIFIWFLFEYLEYERHETSMLYELLRGNYFPFVAVFFSAWVSALIYEVFNAPSGYWQYANIPFSELSLFGIPLFIFIAWPFHYFPLFSLYRILFKGETKEIWK